MSKFKIPLSEGERHADAQVRLGNQEGAWLHEPDHDYFVCSGYTCEVLRHAELGHINGYVHLPPDHPDAFKAYDDVRVDVHGGLTYGSKHNDGTYVFGFDTAHYSDYQPYMHAKLKELNPELYQSVSEHGEYRTMAFVKAEVAQLAQQFKRRERNADKVRRRRRR